MMPHSKDQGSGGLHVNISYNRELEKWRETYINFFIMMANYPEINWILNEPSDNRTANSLQKEAKFKDAMIHLKTDDIETAWKRFSNIGGKSYGVSCKDEYHFEVRTFDMIRNKSELTDIVDFMDSLLRLCHDAALEDLTLPLLEHPVSLFDGALIYHEKEDTAVKDFNRLLRALNLSPKRYRKYIKRNFFVRRDTYGKKYLT